MAFNLLGLLPGAMSLLGGLFGNETKQSTSGTTNQNTSGTTQQGGTVNTQQQTNTTGKTNQTSTQNANTTSNESSTTKGTETGSVLGSVNEATKGTTTGNVTRLDSATTDMLRQGVQDMMGTMKGNQTVIQNELARVSGAGSTFDPAGFVSGIMAGAEVDARAGLESNVNQTRQAIGANSKTNSAAALLENRLNRDTAGSLAATRSNATMTAEQIRATQDANRSTTIGNLAGMASNDFNAMLGSLLQAGETQTQQQEQNSTNTSNQTSTGTSTQTGTNTGTSNTATTGTTNQTSSQDEKTAQNQVSAQQGTQTQNTTGNQKGNTNQNEMKWGDFFTGIGKAFQTQF